MSWHDSHSGKRLARLPPRSRITQTSIAVISERKRCGSALAHRLALVEAIVQSLQFELEPRPQVPKGTLTRLRGLLKTDAPPPTDAEIEAMLEERLKEKYF